MITRGIRRSIVVQALFVSAGVRENQSSTYITKFTKKAHKGIRLSTVGWVLSIVSHMQLTLILETYLPVNINTIESKILHKSNCSLYKIGTICC